MDGFIYTFIKIFSLQVHPLKPGTFSALKITLYPGTNG